MSTKGVLLMRHGLQEYKCASFQAENVVPASGDTATGNLASHTRPVSQCCDPGSVAVATLFGDRYQDDVLVFHLQRGILHTHSM